MLWPLCWLIHHLLVAESFFLYFVVSLGKVTQDYAVSVVQEGTNLLPHHKLILLCPAFHLESLVGLSKVLVLYPELLSTPETCRKVFLINWFFFVQWVVSSGLLLNDYWDPRWVSRPMRVSSMLQFLLLRCSIVLYSLHPSIWLWFFHNHQLTYSAKDGWWWPGKLVHLQCKIWIGTSSHSETLRAPCLSIILIDAKNPDISDGCKIF